MMERRTRVERRRGPDLWMRSLTAVATVGWLIMLAALWVASEAKPEMETFFARWSGIHLRKTWDMQLARYILYLMLFGAFLGYGGLMVNLSRNRRRDDQVRVSLILLSVLSTIGIVVYLVNF